MPTAPRYPRYTTYERLGKKPSVLTQEFPKPALKPDERYYPSNPTLSRHFTSEEELRRFEAESFCEFLADTVEVEHCVVIPAIAALRRIPFAIPDDPKKELYRTATDEGFHAEQSLHYLADLRQGFALPEGDSCCAPLFLRRLECYRLAESNPMHRHLITVLNGIVTETRISVELSQFANDESLASSVRRICHTHAEDEAVHSSQFRALGRWLWEAFDSDERSAASRFLTESTIARSLPDIDRFVDMFHRATGRAREDCENVVYSSYTEEILIDEMLVAARPTVGFLRNLGTDEYTSFALELEHEKSRLAQELDQRRRGLRP